MLGSVRLIFELLADVGSDPQVQIDTDELSPPRFEDIVGVFSTRFVLGPSAVDTAVAIPDSCLLLIVSDEPILLKLTTGETELRNRHFLLAAEDETGLAIAATSLLFSGNTETTANVQVYALAQVT